MTKRNGTSGTSPLILVVDDFEDNRAMYVEYLQFRGYRVAEAVNGLEAIERTRELLPSVIVMDLSLPVMDGWEATRRIKADDQTKHIRVIALTGHAEPAHAKKALDAGCDDFIAKPCLPENLLTKIREHLPAGRGSGSGVSRPGPRNAAPGSGKRAAADGTRESKQKGRR